MGREVSLTGTVSLEVRATGPLALVEDLGRPGHATLGVGPSGAADQAALRVANRLLGNLETAAAVEVTLGGLNLVVRGGDLWVSVAGAPALLRVSGTASGHHGVVLLRDGDELSVGMPERGLRTYVAVRGGVDVPEVLGSRSTDVLSGIGPSPLAAGDVLPVGTEAGSFPSMDVLPDFGTGGGDGVELRVIRGPRDNWVADIEALVRASWTAAEDSNRVGMRLEGMRMDYRAEQQDGRQLPSEGVTRGAVQVPPNGRPVLFLADHPVTGGYPVIAVVVDADVDRAAQVRPGQPVKLRWTD